MPRRELLHRLAPTLLCASVALLSGCALGLADPDPPRVGARLDEVERYAASVVADGDPPSVSVAVLSDDEVVYERAFGLADGPRKIAATPATTYRWFSVTKPFTALAILQLVEAGRIELDAPAARYLPSARAAFGEHADEITIARLLAHESGMGDVGNDIYGWLHREGPHPRELELLDRHLASYFDFDADHVGEGHYSNLGYLVLGGVVEAVTGRSFGAHVEAEILDRLGMSGTGFYYDEPRFSPATRHAVASHPHDFVGFLVSLSLDMDALERESAAGRYWFNRFHPDQSAPSGLVGPSVDALRFARLILRGGEVDGTRLLSSRSISAMLQPRAEIVESPAGDLEGFSFGYGWFLGRDEAGRRLVLHGGGGMGFTTMLMIWPDEARAVFVAANGSYVDGAMGQRLAQAFGAVDW